MDVTQRIEGESLAVVGSYLAVAGAMVCSLISAWLLAGAPT